MKTIIANDCHTWKPCQCSECIGSVLHIRTELIIIWQIGPKNGQMIIPKKKLASENRSNSIMPPQSHPKAFIALIQFGYRMRIHEKVAKVSVGENNPSNSEEEKYSSLQNSLENHEKVPVSISEKRHWAYFNQHRRGINV